MRIIGIDPGTATTGFGIIEENQNGKIDVIDFGVILTASDLSIEKRLQKIHQEISELLFLHRPESGAVEKLFFQKNVTNAIAVGQARGVMLLALANADIDVAEYTPNEVKQSVTGYGSADKKQVQKMVQTILNLSEIPKPDDAADALAIAICHLHSTSYRKLVQTKE